jgi:hypothetical protein
MMPYAQACSHSPMTSIGISGDDRAVVGNHFSNIKANILHFQTDFNIFDKKLKKSSFIMMTR